MAKFLLELIEQLKDLPGFQFLRPYYTSLKAKIYDIQDQGGDLQDTASQFLMGVKKVKNAGKNYKGSKKR